MSVVGQTAVALSVGAVVVAVVGAGVRMWLNRHRHDPIECGCDLSWEDYPRELYGPREERGPSAYNRPRYTYVRGPVRHRDTDRDPD